MHFLQRILKNDLLNVESIFLTPEARQVKIACDVPHLYQSIPVLACNSTYFLQ